MNKLFRDYFWVFFISMLPIIELRGAVPVGVGMGLPFINTYLVAAFGNMIPVPFILWLVKPVLQYMAKFKVFTKLVNFVLEKVILQVQNSAMQNTGHCMPLLPFHCLAQVPGQAAWQQHCWTWTKRNPCWLYSAAY